MTPTLLSTLESSLQEATRSCPFCGQSNVVFQPEVASWRHNEGTVLRIVGVCGDCGAHGPAFGHLSINDHVTATKYWNKRADSLPLLLDVVKAAQDAVEIWKSEEPNRSVTLNNYLRTLNRHLLKLTAPLPDQKGEK